MKQCGTRVQIRLFFIGQLSLPCFAVVAGEDPDEKLALLVRFEGRWDHAVPAGFQGGAQGDGA